MGIKLEVMGPSSPEVEMWRQEVEAKLNEKLDQIGQELISKGIVFLEVVQSPTTARPVAGLTGCTRGGVRDE